jgi:type IV pilus assembly protein PilF
VTTTSIGRAAFCALALAVLAACTTTTTTSQRTPEATDPSSTNPNDPSEVARRTRVRLELASAYFAQGQTTTALDEVKLALQANPNSVEAYNLRGLIYARLSDDAQADESFKHALQINPRDADTLHNYGWYQCQQRRYAEAQALFTQVQALPQFRDAPRILLVQGVCQARAGQMAEAERSLARAFEVDPSNVAVQVNLAEVLYRRGELERARFYIKRVNNQPDQSNAQTLWLAAKIEHAAKQQHALDELGAQLHRRFPQSREAAAFEQGRFDEQ